MSSDAFVPVAICVLTVSDTRTEADDTSGGLLISKLSELGHRIVERRIVRDELATIRNAVHGWVESPEVQVVITTGGTGITARDVTPEAIEPLIDKRIDGFGELFRFLSYDDIGASTIQSRAIGGIAGKTLVFALPGSTSAVRLALEKILVPQLDSRTKPCNFVGLFGRL
jgi:molybdenum cofactor biosynthesis protein B